MKISRRTAIAMIGGGILASGAGITLVASLSDEDLVRAVLERHLGGLEMDRADIAAFLADFRERRPWLFPPVKLATVYGVAEQLDVEEFTRKALPGGRGEDITRFERHLLAEFFAHTDVSYRSSPQDRVTHLGSSACLNPFAEFA